MRKYVDCDGVIFDSEVWLFDDEFRSLKIENELEKIKYVQKKDWNEILRKSEIINDAINILKELKDVAILTKVHSMENEGVAKIKLFTTPATKTINLCNQGLLHINFSLLIFSSSS